MLDSISSSFTKWNKHMMDTRDYQVSFTFGPCDYQQEISLRVHLLDFISKAVSIFDILLVLDLYLCKIFLMQLFNCLLFCRVLKYVTHVPTT